MLELNRQVRDLYAAYGRRPIKPETSLEVAGDFVLDLINVFGDELTGATPLKPEWCQFAPFEFVLGLNGILTKYKNSGYEGLDAAERSLLHDAGALLSGLIEAALTSHPDGFPEEDHYQIPNSVAKELRTLAKYGM